MSILQREAIRAILLTEQRETLLLRIVAPDGRAFWITPGGGMEPGESPESALRRELQEELGIEQFTLGPLLWKRQHTFTWAGQRICQREDYHVVHVPRFEPRMSDPLEAKWLDRFRWWTLDELATTSELLTPLSLAQIVSRYLTEGAPIAPLEIEVLVD